MGIALTLAVREPRDVPATTVIDEFALRDRSPGDEADEQSAAMWLQSGQRIADATAAAQIAHDSNVEVGCPAARSGIAAPVADVFALVGAMLQSRKAADEAEAVAAAAAAHAKVLRIAADEAFADEECTTPVEE